MCRFITSGLAGGAMPRQGWKALLRVLRVCLTRETSLVKESVNLSGPLIQIVIDSIATGAHGNNGNDGRYYCCCWYWWLILYYCMYCMYCM